MGCYFSSYPVLLRKFMKRTNRYSKRRNMHLEPKTIKNPSGILPEILHYILEYLNTTDLMNLKEAGGRKLKEIVDESIEKREKTSTHILITTGSKWFGNISNASSASYMLKLYKKFPHELILVKTFPHAATSCFSCVCDGRLIVGAGETKDQIDLNDVFEYDAGKWKKLRPYTRYEQTYGQNSAAAYLENYLVVCGGYSGDGDTDDRVRMLKIDANYCSPEWVMCSDRLPIGIYGHQITSFMGKLILTGGNIIGSPCNRVWEGTINLDEPNITWKKLPSMKMRRSFHVAFPIENKLYVLGSVLEEVTTCEYFNGKNWEIGPDLGYPLHDAAAIIDKRQRAIIIGGLHHSGSAISHTSVTSKIISFHPEHGFLDIKTVELPEPLSDHVALLC